MSEDGGSAKRFFLLGTDYVYPRTTNKILRSDVCSSDLPGVAPSGRRRRPWHTSVRGYRRLAARREFFDVGDDGLIVAVAEPVRATPSQPSRVPNIG